MRCPICKKPVDPPQPASGAASAKSKPTFPFCSDRCELIDLGRWLDGRYQVPVIEEDVDEHSAPQRTTMD